MRVLRIEDKNGIGAFNSGLVLAAESRLINAEWDQARSAYRHPSPDEDVQRWDYILRDYYCGFIGPRQLLQWFDCPLLRQALRLVGAQLVEYDCPVELILPGKYQIMFQKASATRIRTTEIPL